MDIAFHVVFAQKTRGVQLFDLCGLIMLVAPSVVSTDVLFIVVIRLYRQRRWYSHN